MKLKEMSKIDLELMSYTDLTNLLLKETNKTMNTKELFKEICNLLNYDKNEYENKIGDYYTSLTIDKRFILLENGMWDLSSNHSLKLIIDEDEVLEDETDEENIEEEPEEIDEIIEEDLEEDDDSMDDLRVVDDLEEDE